MAKREPNTEVEVYKLDHYEAMQIDLAIKAFLENDEEKYDEMLDVIDDTVLRRLSHIFSNGVLMIVKEQEAE